VSIKNKLFAQVLTTTNSVNGCKWVAKINKLPTGY
jgi:hypothetical protein